MSRIVLVLLFLAVVDLAAAQRVDLFEGAVHFRVSDRQPGTPAERSYSFFTASDRIWLESSHSHRLLAGLDADRFLVRGSQNDFTFLNRKDEALQLTREELEGMAGLLQQMRGRSDRVPFDWEDRVEETGRTRTIQGHQTEEFRVRSEEPGKEVSVWLSDEIKIDWGLLQEVWHQSLSTLIQTELPMELFMNRNSFPLLIEYVEGEETITRVEAVLVQKRTLPASQFELPDGIQMIGLSDVMTRMFMRR